MEVDTNELLHRIGAVLRVISDKMDRLIEVGERVEGEVRLPSELEAQTFADAKEPAKEPPKKWRILEPGEVVCSSDLVNAKLNPPSDPPNGLGWIPVIASVGATVCEDDPGIFARLVADEPAKEPEHPAGPQPDPGEGYRLLSKDPPEKLSPGDDFWSPSYGEWHKSTCAASGIRFQSDVLWFRRKIEQPKDEYREPMLPADAGKECEVSDDGKTWVGGKVYGWRVAPHSWWAWGRWYRFARIKVDA